MTNVGRTVQTPPPPQMLIAPAASFGAMRSFAQLNPEQLFGILFAPTFDELGKMIAGRMTYLNIRTGKKIHFLCPGYGTGGFAADQTPVGDIHAPDGSSCSWGFSQVKFGEIVDEVHAQTSFRFSGKTDLILMRGFDLSNAIIFNVSKMVVDEAIDSAEGLLEAVIRFAETDGEIDHISNKRGLRILGEAAAKAILDLLPEVASGVFKKGRHWRVQDITRR